MRVVITSSARESFRQIYLYYKSKGIGKLGRKIRVTVTAKIMLLKDHSFIGQEEETLKQLNEGHRYLVEGNYKVIYKIIDQTVYITDIFDTRQNPDSIKT